MDINFIFGILGVALAIIGLIASFYFYRKSIRIKEPVYSIISTNVISNYASKYKNLTVSYKDEKVENFTVSKVLFFNKGPVTIDRDDIPTLNPLRVAAKTGSILDATILQVNNISSDFNVSLDRINGWVMIDFDYLNQNQGAVIEVIHTALSSKDLDVVGDMKEVKSLIRLSPNAINVISPLNSWRAIGKMIFGVFAWFLLFGTIFITYGTFREVSSSPLGIERNVGFTMVVFFSAMCLLLLWSLRRWGAFSKGAVIPSGLEKFDE